MARKPEDALAWLKRGLALDTKGRHGTLAGRDLGEQRVRWHAREVVGSRPARMPR